MRILDTDLRAEIQRRLEVDGPDKHDEVWEGVVQIMPLANIEHQVIVAKLNQYIAIALGLTSPHFVFSGVNVSDRAFDWITNYREPDVAVYLQGNPAVNYDTHWMGGPDFLAEIASPNDHCREKLPFYASIGTREVLIVDRDPWQLELYRLRNGILELAGRCDATGGEILQPQTVPISLRMIPSEGRPKIEVTASSGQVWAI